MALVVGTIRSGGLGVPGLLVKAIEETKVGMDLEDDRPCRFGTPVARQIGQDLTDATGNFSISYVPRERPEDACGFSATVRVGVFDGATLVWSSPKKMRAATTRFDHDLLPPPPDPDEPRARIFGTLTRCGQPAAEHRVLAYEVVRVGVTIPTQPCHMLPPRIRHVGTAVVSPQGRFDISYHPTPEPSEDDDVCEFVQTVRIGVFDNVAQVWQSPDHRLDASVRIDHELYPDCSEGSTLVRVVNESGQRVAGAEVFADGTTRGLTDGAGQLFVAGLHAGSVLVSSRRILEHETHREGHKSDTDRNWNYRVYITSATLVHDAEGNNPRFEMVTVADPAATHELVLRRRNAIVGFNLLLSVEWAATPEQLFYLRDRLLEFSELIFNGTDGQFLLERVSVVDNGTQWNQADVRDYADWDQASQADPNGVNGTSGAMHMGPFDIMFPGNLLHEFGHYAFDLWDEYLPGDCWPGGGPNPVCTVLSGPDGTVFSEGGSKDACFMRGAQNESRKKLCSAHPANPHHLCTGQGAEDCWSVVVQRYGGQAEWQLQTPVSRGAIADRLPDSGVPFGGTTHPPSGDRAESYIPVAAWKPHWHVRLVTRIGACPALIVRVTRNGTPVDNARVTLETSDGRTILQGRTAGRTTADGVTTGPGEISLRGAHVGDSVNASVSIGPFSFGRTVTIGSCVSPLVIDLPIPGVLAGIRATVHDDGGVGLSIQPASREPLVPPVISVQREGELEPFTLDARAVAGGLARVIFSDDRDQNADVRITRFDSEGNAVLFRTRMAQRLLLTEDPRRILSATGEVQLALPRAALASPARIVIEEAIDIAPPALEPGDDLIVVPHRLSSTRGNRLKAPALLHVNPGTHLAADREGRAGSIALLAYDPAKEDWAPIAARVNWRPLAATASIDELGVFALVRRAGGRGRPV